MKNCGPPQETPHFLKPCGKSSRNHSVRREKQTCLIYENLQFKIIVLFWKQQKWKYIGKKMDHRMTMYCIGLLSIVVFFFKLLLRRAVASSYLSLSGGINNLILKSHAGVTSKGYAEDIKLVLEWFVWWMWIISDIHQFKKWFTYFFCCNFSRWILMRKRTSRS